MTDSPRLIGRKEAAEYCGISQTCFSMWVASHKMPPAIPGTRKWDKRAIDAKLDEISGLAVKNNGEDEFDRWERENRHEGPARQSSALQDWREKKRRRDKYRPQLGLDAKLERIVLFMADHPECDTLDVIPWAGPVFMEFLIQRGAVRLCGKDARGQQKYSLTDEGKAEVVRIRKWRLAP